MDDYCDACKQRLGAEADYFDACKQRLGAEADYFDACRKRLGAEAEIERLRTDLSAARKTVANLTRVNALLIDELATAIWTPSEE